MANQDFHWTPEDLAWAAGLFEGEGCIALSRPAATRPQVQWNLVLASTDLDVLERLQTVVGMGQISGPRDRGHKLHWVWCVSRREHVRLLLEAMLPWLGSRRRARAEECLAFFEANPPGMHRSSLCKAGLHVRTEENVRVSVDEQGRVRRRCIPCAQASSRRYYEKTREVA